MPAALGNATIAGDDAFTVAGEDCPGSLEPGGRCRYTVLFAPAAPGEFGGDLVVPVTNGEPLRVRLSGTASELIVVPVTGDFGKVRVGESAERTFTLTNGGQEAAVISGASAVEGEFFSLGSNTCREPLQPGSSCAMTVVFAPQPDRAEGLADRIDGTLTVVISDPPGRIQVPLSGEAILPAPSR